MRRHRELILVLIVSACGEEPCELQPALSSIRTCVLSPKCTAPCHSGGAAAAGDLDMSGNPYASIVDVPSRGDCAPSLLIAPGRPADSVLWLKVTAKAAGTSPPCGDGMPLGTDRDALEMDELDALEQWILAGANDD